MVPGDEGFTRRIAGVLVADRDAASSADAGEDDLVAHALESLRESGGDVERLGPGTVLAGFDLPDTAVQAADRLHRDAFRR